jgi:hypothetical protein
MEIPVTPPSINLLDNKKPFSPIAADRMPNKMEMKFWISALTLTFHIG